MVEELAPRVTHLGGLLFTEFTVAALVVAVLAWGVARRAAASEQRETMLVVLSVALVAWFTGVRVAAAWVGFALAMRVAAEMRGPAGTAGVVGLLGAMIALPVAYIGPLGDQGRHAREFTAFATNVALLRFWAFAWDRRRGTAPREPLARYLLAMFFFPTFPNGPIEPARTMAAPWPRPGVVDLRAGLVRVAGGVAKLVVVALALAPGWTSALADGPAAPAWRLWAWGALLYAWFYLSFSAWADVAIGLGRMAGRRVQENFDRPWLATGPGDFWRRWHVSLGLWLRDYVYVPLGGNRRRRAVNVLVVFLVSAAWHVWGTLKLLGFGYFPVEAWGGFVVWGAVHAAAVVAVGRRGDGSTTRTGRLGRRAATFAFAAWAWIPFFLPASVPLADGLRMMLRMLWPFA